MGKEYGADNITVLEGLKAVRKRPAMYIGTTSIDGVHQLVYETTDNSIDEAMAGQCSKISITIHKDNSVTVSDNGRGIPVELHSKRKKPAVEVVMTVLHAGGKFDNDSYKVSGGLHGVGVSVVNALSEYLTVTIHKHGKKWYQKFARGEPVTELKKLKGKVKDTGTSITFLPDVKIFENINHIYDVLAKRFEELAYLNSGLRINFEDERENKEVTYKFDGGIKSFVKKINETESTLHKTIYGSDEVKEVVIEFCMQYNNGNKSDVYSFANNIRTKEGGTHLSGFKTALTRTLNNYIQNSQELPKKYHKEKISGEDVFEGIAAVVNVKIPDPQFEGQTKTKLGNSEVTKHVSKVVGDWVKTYLEENPKDARTIIDKVVETAQARTAAKQAKENIKRKSNLTDSALPGKLADCQNKDPLQSELFIVEGDSAGGSAKQGRDPKTQAILPLKGKIINVEKTRFDKMLKNQEIQHLITALGTNLGGDDLDLSRLRYHRIIIMTDADVDGAHIRTLLLTFFYRQYRQAIEQGYLYIANPPLYRVYKSKFEKYIADDEELRDFLIQNVAKDISVEKDGTEYKGKKLVSLLKDIAKLQDKLKEGVNVGLNEDLFLSIIKFNYALAAGTLNEQNKDIKNKFKKHMEENDYDLTIKQSRKQKRKGSCTLYFTDRNAKKIKLDSSFFSTNLYANAFDLVHNLDNSEYVINWKNQEQEFDSPFDLFDNVISAGYKKFNVQRYKGLGEMNPEQLWKTTMKEDNRNLSQVKISEAEESDLLFRQLMGEKVEPRRDFIQKNALAVEELDI